MSSTQLPGLPPTWAGPLDSVTHPRLPSDASSFGLSSEHGRNSPYQFLPPPHPAPYRFDQDTLPMGPTVLDPQLAREAPDASCDRENHPPGGPSTKVAGARQHKAKSRLADRSLKRSPAIGATQQPMSKRHHGRVSSCANYSANDISALLDCVEAELPLGAKGWQKVTSRFTEWSEDNHRPTRLQKSLEVKYKQLVKTLKPTGDGECPPEVDRAHTIEHEINTKAGTRDLDDSDIDNGTSTSSEEIVATPFPVPLPIPREQINTARRSHSTSGQELLKNISNALDPAAQMICNEECTARSVQATQILSLSNQLRDTQTQLKNLRNRLAETEHERNAAERRADRSELLSMLREGTTPRRPRPHPTLGESRPIQHHESHDGDESDSAGDSPVTRAHSLMGETSANTNEHGDIVMAAV